MIKNIIKKIIYPNNYSSEALIKYLRKKGVSIGENTYFFNSTSIKVDVNRGRYIKIGAECKIASDVSIIAHDYSWTIARKVYNEILPTGGKKIIIGDNVFIGQGVTVLRGGKNRG